MSEGRIAFMSSLIGLSSTQSCGAVGEMFGLAGRQEGPGYRLVQAARGSRAAQLALHS